jgi:voltage-gated potassium channel
MDPQSTLQRWEKHAEWPLAAVAVVFLAAFSVEVLAQPTGAAAVAVDVVTWTVWGIFAVDYVVRLALAPDRRRWFLHHLLDLAVVALPLLRPLRLLRLVVLVAAFQQAIGNAIRGRVVVYTVSGAVLLV